MTHPGKEALTVCSELLQYPSAAEFKISRETMTDILIYVRQLEWAEEVERAADIMKARGMR